MLYMYNKNVRYNNINQKICIHLYVVTKLKSKNSRK